MIRNVIKNIKGHMSPPKYVSNAILNSFGEDVNTSPCCRCPSLVCSAPGA